MKKFLVLFALTVFSFTSAKAETTFKLDAAGDVYFATDNAKIGMDSVRQYSVYNVQKGTVGINNAFLIGRAIGDVWRVNVGAGLLDGNNLHIEEANVALNIVKDLWIEGGYFGPSLAGDCDYTFDAWFTSNSLTDRMSSGYQTGIGLFYEFTPGITAKVRAINSGYTQVDNNTSTSMLVGFDWETFAGLRDWTLSLGTLIGNETDYPTVPRVQTLSALHLRGKIVEDLDANLRFKFGTLGAKDEGDGLSAMSAQVMLRYALCEKMGVGCRFAYTNDEDGIFGVGNSGIDLGLVFEYRPIQNAYIRLEGNMLSLSNSENDIATKVFLIDNELKNSRMDAAISLGYNFNLFEATR